jgi:hypothetical protein
MGHDVELPPDDVNPYAPPSAAQTGPHEPESSDFAMFLRWERLRLLYNAILGVVTILGMLAPHHGLRGNIPNQIVGLIPLGLGANVCYCIGPVLEGYAHLIGLRGKVVTGILFGLGTAFAALLAWAAILGWGIDADRIP